jgi:ParB/RepB/Spo0J family partition protein
MENITKELLTVEHHCLNLQYAHLRFHKASARDRLANSIEQNGQLMPVIVVPDSQQKWIIIDGYLRVQALKRLGKDTIVAEVWQCDAAEALLMVLKSHSGRTLEIFEEALLLKELHTQHGLSQMDLSRRVGRGQSWVSHRLSLIEFLPDNVLQAISNSKISIWIASRVIAPIARAIPEHAQKLLNYLLKNAQRTRDMDTFYKHYQCSNIKERTNMINNPELFFKAKKITDADKQAAILKDGPEGKWRYKIALTISLLSELFLLAPIIFYQNQKEMETQELLQKFNKAKTQFNTLINMVEKLTNARTRNTQDNNLLT